MKTNHEFKISFYKCLQDNPKVYRIENNFLEIYKIYDFLSCEECDALIQAFQNEEFIKSEVSNKDTNKEFRTDSHPKGTYHKLLEPFDDFYENHLNEYSIQLSMYAAILEEWGFEIGGAYLVHIGPGEEDAQMYKVVDMRDNIKKFFGDQE